MACISYEKAIVHRFHILFLYQKLFFKSMFHESFEVPYTMPRGNTMKITNCFSYLYFFPTFEKDNFLITETKYEYVHTLSLTAYSSRFPFGCTFLLAGGRPVVSFPVSSSFCIENESCILLRACVSECSSGMLENSKFKFRFPEHC